MENLQLVLLILGAIAIIAVLVHGFWSIRKQQPKSLKEASTKGCFTDKSDRDPEGFDADGIGKVRVSKAKPLASPTPQHVQRGKNVVGGRGQKASPIKPTQDNAGAYQQVRAEEIDSANSASSPQMASSEQVRASQSVTSQHAPLAEHQVDIEQLTEMPGISEPSVQENPLSHRHVETVASQDALLFGHQEVGHQDADNAEQEREENQPQAVATEPQSIQTQADKGVDQNTLGEPQDVLVLHVAAKDGEIFNGAELLPCLLTLNFKFGDMNIFHRHQDNAGKGQVLFSLANMVKPGVFNPDHMEQFNTQGVVLFMTLPCHGDALMNFSIMLNCAHQIADDLQGQVLDGGRELWLESTKQAYLQRIKN